MAGVLIEDRSFTMLECAVTGVRNDLIPLIPEEKLSKFEEFHACELYGGYGVFEGIDQDKRFEAIHRLLFCLKFGNCSVVYGGVDMDALGDEIYASADPLDISFRICVKGIRSWIDEKILGHAASEIPDEMPKDDDMMTTVLVKLIVPWLEELIILIVDDCDKKMKTSLYNSFRSLRLGVASPTNKLHYFHDDMYFGDSRYSIGIQLADLCSYFIARHLEGDSEIRGFFDMIQPYIVFSETHPKGAASNEKVEAGCPTLDFPINLGCPVLAFFWLGRGSPTLSELSCMGMFKALEGWQRLDGFAGLPLGEADLIKALQIQPEFRGRAEEMGQAQGRVAGDGAPSIQDFGDAIGGNIQLPRQFRGAHAQLFQLFR
jgi:hypothetical protein